MGKEIISFTLDTPVSIVFESLPKPHTFIKECSYLLLAGMLLPVSVFFRDFNKNISKMHEQKTQHSHSMISK